MKQNNKKTGKIGEDLVVEFLKKKGFLIVERNFSTRFGEIDIVCLDGEKLVFVEVKTKIGHNFGEPEDMVSGVKLMQVQRMGEVYIEVRNAVSDGILKNWKGGCRVDVVGVILTESGEVEEIRHHEGVY